MSEDIPETVDKLRTTLASGIENILKREDPTDTDPKPEDIYFNDINDQKDEELPISDEFAGMIFFATQLAKNKQIEVEKAMGWLRQFYEFDTGKLLKVNQINALLYHKKVMSYSESIKDNIKIRYDKLQRLKKIEDPESFSEEKTDPTE